MNSVIISAIICVTIIILSVVNSKKGGGRE